MFKMNKYYINKEEKLRYLLSNNYYVTNAFEIKC